MLESPRKVAEGTDLRHPVSKYQRLGVWTKLHEPMCSKYLSIILTHIRVEVHKLIRDIISYVVNTIIFQDIYADYYKLITAVFGFFFINAIQYILLHS